MTDVVERLVDANNELVGYVYWCPGCEEAHQFRVPPWTFDGNMQCPTVGGSVRVRGGRHGQDHLCHAFIRGGKIQYLNDCTHPLKGQTIDMVPVPWGDPD